MCDRDSVQTLQINSKIVERHGARETTLILKRVHSTVASLNLICGITRGNNLSAILKNRVKSEFSKSYWNYN